MDAGKRGGRGKERERAEMDADLQSEVAFSVAGILLLFVLIVSCMLKPSHTLRGSPRVHFYEKLTFPAV